jgi:DNA invertase Pin-like site-specific DNA recombinase
MTSTTLRPIGIVRVSQRHGRDDDSFHTPHVQRETIEALCQREGWAPPRWAVDEIDVSGDALLADRPGLSQAVTAVLSGDADVIVSATTERLWWNHEVRAQVLRLVEEAGGAVWSADEGRLSNGSAAEEFTGTVRTAADRFGRRQNADKSWEAVERAIAEGKVPWAGVTPGYRRTDDGRFVPDPEQAQTVLAAFELRAEGATIKAVRAYLREHGIERSHHGVQELLKSRTVLGEIHFGDHTPNRAAHQPIVPVELWQRVQRVRVARGRRSKSDRLLARLGVLRCATCNARMVVGTANHGAYNLYRCPPTGDCPERVTISAPQVEAIVVDAVKARLADVEGRASAQSNAREAVAAAERAQADLDAAIRAFAGVADEQAAVERLAELTRRRDEARERADRLRGTGSTVSVSVDDWERLPLDVRRQLVVATIERVRVSPGRGGDRVAIELVGE